MVIEHFISKKLHFITEAARALASFLETPSVASYVNLNFWTTSSVKRNYNICMIEVTKWWYDTIIIIIIII